MSETPIHCPSCSVRVPAGTGKFCPACGELMAVAPTGPVGGPLDPSAQSAGPGASRGYLEVEETAMAMPIALAAGGALIGALLWAGIAYATGMEIGYVAWMLGGLVGGGCAIGGGRGPVLAATAAALAFAGMVGGRFLGTSLLVGEQIEVVAQMFDRQAFEELRASAAEHDAAGRPAMPIGEPGIDENGEAWTEAELREVAAYQERMLGKLLEPGYTFEHWRDEQMHELTAQLSVWDILKETVGLIDVLFVLLGLSTAYGMVAKAQRS